ncbi:MATE family efflux transporter [Paenibacillus spiritus]|uniref:Probable multidrug resistance protein NorM n=1 Tax=Paenibacillus spiritus TaxID=2496557 RepID=A0A5J5G5K9_9BACL|nr:MATE family efflux transporter [Paenibacillus spiritus]
MEPQLGSRGKTARQPGRLARSLTGETMDYRTIAALFLPILVDQIFVVGLNVANTAMISSAGVAAVSAVNMIDSLNIFLISVFIAVSTGGTVVVAQYKGSGNDAMVSRATAGTVSSVSLLALATGLAGIALSSPLLRLLFGAAEPEVMANARLYLIGSCISYLGIAVVEAVCGALRGIGRTRASLWLSLIMNIAYVLLNVLFINGFRMGVLGMTLAINIARYLGAACAVYYLFRLDTSLRLKLKDLLAVKLDMVKRILSIGMPFAAEQMFFNGGKILTQTFVVSLGTYAIATNAISGSIALVMQIPANALSLTIVTVVGQCMGSRNIDDASKFIKTFLKLSSLSFALMGLLVLPFFHPLISLFHPPAAIVDDIWIIVLMNTIIQVPLWSISFITPAALRAAGDAKFTSLVAMLSMWLFRVVLGYLLGIVFGFGIIGIWVAMECEWAIRGTIFLRRFLSRRWARHQVI